MAEVDYGSEDYVESKKDFVDIMAYDGIFDRAESKVILANISQLSNRERNRAYRAYFTVRDLAMYLNISDARDSFIGYVWNRFWFDRAIRKFRLRYG